MKIKLFTKQNEKTSHKNDNVIKFGKKQVEKLIKKGIYIQLVRSEL